jgi:hypothetical protein
MKKCFDACSELVLSYLFCIVLLGGFGGVLGFPVVAALRGALGSLGALAALDTVVLAGFAA